MDIKKHEHSGCARRSLENPVGTLSKAGIRVGDYMLLDIGSGSGYLSIVAAGIMGGGSKVYALDSHEEAVKGLEKAVEKNGLTNIFPIKADAAEKIPLKRDSVDICLMSNVIHGFAANAEIDKVLKNVNAVLKDEGTLIVIDFKKMQTAFGPPLEFRLSPDEVKDIITPYGYVSKQTFEASLENYAVVFKKETLQDRFC